MTVAQFASQTRNAPGGQIWIAKEFISLGLPLSQELVREHMADKFLRARIDRWIREQMAKPTTA